VKRTKSIKDRTAIKRAALAKSDKILSNKEIWRHKDESFALNHKLYAEFSEISNFLKVNNIKLFYVDTYKNIKKVQKWLDSSANPFLNQCQKYISKVKETILILEVYWTKLFCVERTHFETFEMLRINTWEVLLVKLEENVLLQREQIIIAN